jgi:hypothetical protein
MTWFFTGEQKAWESRNLLREMKYGAVVGLVEDSDYAGLILWVSQHPPALCAVLNPAAAKYYEDGEELLRQRSKLTDFAVAWSRLARLCSANMSEQEALGLLRRRPTFAEDVMVEFCDPVGIPLARYLGSAIATKDD